MNAMNADNELKATVLVEHYRATAASEKLSLIHISEPTRPY